MKKYLITLAPALMLFACRPAELIEPQPFPAARPATAAARTATECGYLSATCLRVAIQQDQLNLKSAYALADSYYQEYRKASPFLRPYRMQNFMNHLTYQVGTYGSFLAGNLDWLERELNSVADLSGADQQARQEFAVIRLLLIHANRDMHAYTARLGVYGSGIPPVYRPAVADHMARLVGLSVRVERLLLRLEGLR